LNGAPVTQFITGAAGTGKTFEIKPRILEDPDYGIVCATTGTAAVDGITIDSLLHQLKARIQRRSEIFLKKPG